MITPNGWNTVNFDEVVFFQEGPGVRNWQFRDKGIKLLNVRNVVGGKLHLENTSRYLDSDEVDKKYRHFLLDEGDLVMASSGVTWGKIAYVNEQHLPLCLNTSMIRLRPRNEQITHSFIRTFVESYFFRGQISRLITGSAQPNFGPSHLNKITIPLPPLAEQKRIAGILDAADALRAKRRESLAQLDTLLQSTFLTLFGDPVTNPMGWEVVSVGDEITFMTSGSRGWAKYYADDGDIFIRIQNLKAGRLDLGDIAFVDAPDSTESKRTRVEPGDILLSITADLGRTAVVPERIGKAHINQHLAILRFADLNPCFVSYQLASRGGQAQFARLNREGVKAGLNFNDIKSIKLTKPPLELQRRFADIVESIERQKTRQRAHLAELDALFASLQSRAFNGEL